MRLQSFLLAGISTLLFAVASHGEVKVVAERSADSSGFKFKSVPLPAKNDAAAKALENTLFSAGDRVTWLHSDICRSALLIEIEATLVASM